MSFYTKLFLFISVLIYSDIMYSQDIHFSMYQFAPLNVNPAMAGAFNGSYRVQGIYSDDFASVTARPYQTVTLSADAPIIRGFRKQDWIGVGLEFTALNRSGEMNNEDGVESGFLQNWTIGKIGLAYHLSLDKKQTNIITLGGQYINMTRNFGQTLDQWDSRYGILAGGVDPDIMKLQQNQGNQQDQGASLGGKNVNIGMMFTARRKLSDLKVGFAMRGLFDQRIGITERTVFGLNIHATYERMLNKKLQIVPGFFYYQLGPANAWNANAQSFYTINEDKGFKLGGGLGTRAFRQAILMIGGEYKDIKFGISYDADISDLSVASGSVGGFELAIGYLGKIFKTPKPKPVIFCPRL